MADLIQKKRIVQYEARNLQAGDQVVGYDPDALEGERTFRGNILVGDAAGIADGTSTEPKMYTDAELNSAINSGAIPVGTVDEIKTAAGATPKIYSPKTVGDAIDESIFEGSTIFKTSIADVEAIADMTDGQPVYLSLGGRSGPFQWALGDFSAEVAADTLQGVYIASSTVAATVGAWVRKLDGYVTPEMLGAIGDGVYDDYQAVSSAIYLASVVDVRLVLSKTYRISSGIVFDAAGINVEAVSGSYFKPDPSVLVAVTIGRDLAPYPSRMTLDGLKVDRLVYNGDTENIGFLYLESNQCTFKDFESRYSKYNHQFSPSAAGMAYNTIINPQAVGGYNNFLFNATGTGFANENTFIGGRGFVTANTVVNLEIANSSGQADHNRFIGMSLEGNAISIRCAKTCNYFEFPRTEGSTTDVEFTATAQYNMVVSSRYDLSVVDAGSRNQYITYGSGTKLVTANNDKTTLTVDRLGSNSGAVPAVMINDVYNTSGDSYGIEVRSGRDTANGYIIRGVRDSDGLDGFYVTSTGNGYLRSNLKINQSGWNFSPLTMGSRQFWVDGQGRFLAKTGTPTSDTDGTSAGFGPTQFTVGGAGAGSALPATPAGYAKIMIAGNEFVIPYYSVS